LTILSALNKNFFVKFGPQRTKLQAPMLTYRKSHFSEDHISAPKGCCAPKFLHVLQNDQVLLAHPPPGTGAPLQLFSKGGQKLA